MTQRESFVVGRVAQHAGDIERAALLFERAAAGPDKLVAARSLAHLSHVAYFRGDFDLGVRRALDVRALDPLARAEAALYESANRIALNQGGAAMHAAERALKSARRVASKTLRADLRFRCARQLVHVYVAVGEYARASDEADAAAAASRIFVDHRRRGYVAYLRGFVDASRGHATATAHFAQAEAHWSVGYPGLLGWLRLLWAGLLRDLGDTAVAEIIRPRDRELPAWEGALFALARGDRPSLPDPAKAPADERPFLLAARGVERLAYRDASTAADDLAEAVLDFERSGLRHYRRGAAMMFAFAQAAAGRPALAQDLIRREGGAIVAQDLRRWPWWNMRIVASNAPVMRAAGLDGAVVDQLVEAQNLAINDEGLLAAHGLTTREVELVHAWIANSHYSRAQLAAALGIREASVRAHLNSIRRKLEPPSRGPTGLRRAVAALRSGQRQAGL